MQPLERAGRTETGVVMYRRDLPGGHVVMVSIDDRVENEIIGRLQIERRTNADRRRDHIPPIVAEVRGPTRADVLEQLRRIADSDAEVRERLETWLAARRSASSWRRVQMPDGEWWTVERRHEMTQLSRRGSARERRLYLFFRNDAGGLRRAEVADEFPLEAPVPELQLAFVRAEILV